MYNLENRFFLIRWFCRGSSDIQYIVCYTYQCATGLGILVGTGLLRFGRNLKGGGPSQFFGRINFEHRAPQVPLIIGETFGEDSGPWRPTTAPWLSHAPKTSKN